MSIKYYDHKNKIVREVKNLTDDEYAGVLYVMDKNKWTKRTIDGEEVWVSSKASLSSKAKIEI